MNIDRIGMPTRTWYKKITIQVTPTLKSYCGMNNLKQELAKDKYWQDRNAYKDMVQKMKSILTKLFKSLQDQLDIILGPRNDEIRSTSAPGYDNENNGKRGWPKNRKEQMQW